MQGALSTASAPPACAARRTRRGRGPLVAILSAILGLLVGLPAPALTITGTLISAPGLEPPAPQHLVGGGDIETIFEAAAALWEAAILDDVTIDISYAWRDLSAYGFLGQNPLGTVIFLDNSGNYDWFLDPTPYLDEEWLTYQETTADLGSPAGPLNVGRFYTDFVAGGSFLYDAFSVLLHEIGHAIGFREDGDFNDEVVDGDIDIAAPLPFAGASLPNYAPPGNSGDHLGLADTLMYPFIDSGVRTLLSEADIVALAQVEGYSQVDLDPVRVVPEPGTALLLAAGLLGLATRARPRG